MRAHHEMILGLDVGSATICAAVCEIDRAGELNLRGVGTSVSTGMVKGEIVDPQALHQAIDRAIKKAGQRAHGTPLRVITNLPYHQMQFMHNVGFVLSKEETGQISESDKQECVRRARNIFKTADQKMMHVIPLCFKVDGVEVKNPVGVFGRNIEVNTHLILGHAGTIVHLTRILKEMGFYISGLVYDMLASSQVLLTQQEMKDGVILIDIGGQFTKVGVFYQGVLHKTAVVSIGGDTITSDIAVCMETSIPEAERLKILKGHLVVSDIDPEENIDVLTKESGHIEAKRTLLCQIIEARLSELVQLIQKEIPFQFDPNYTCVISGGTALMSGTREYFQKCFEMPVRLGLPDEVGHIIQDVTHASAIGLVLYGIKAGVVLCQRKSRSRGIMGAIWRVATRFFLFFVCVMIVS